MCCPMPISNREGFPGSVCWGMISYIGALQWHGVFRWERRISGLAGQVRNSSSGYLLWWYPPCHIPWKHGFPGWERGAIGPVAKENIFFSCLLTAALPVDLSWWFYWMHLFHERPFHFIYSKNKFIWDTLCC